MRANTARIDFYKTITTLGIDLIEARTGKTMHEIDPSIENRLEVALHYGNVKELRELHNIIEGMYDAVKRKY